MPDLCIKTKSQVMCVNDELTQHVLFLCVHLSLSGLPLPISHLADGVVFSQVNATVLPSPHRL